MLTATTRGWRTDLTRIVRSKDAGGDNASRVTVCALEMVARRGYDVSEFEREKRPLGKVGRFEEIDTEEIQDYLIPVSASGENNDDAPTSNNFFRYAS